MKIMMIRTEWLKNEIEKLYKSIKEELAKNCPRTISDTKPFEELVKLRENKDSLFNFYKTLRYQENDFDPDTFELIKDTWGTWLTPDENEPIDLNRLFYRLVLTYPGKIVDIRTKEPNEEAIDQLQSYMYSLKELYGDDWDIDDKDFDELLQYIGKFNGLNTRQAELSPTIIKSNLSPVILEHFKTVTECYRFEQYAAAIVFCRALLEEAYQQIYGDKLGKNLSLDVLVKLSQKNEINLDHGKIDKINKTANNILHDIFIPEIKEGPGKLTFEEKGDTLVSVRNRLMESMKDVALRCIKDTVFLLEKAFN